MNRLKHIRSGAGLTLRRLEDYVDIPHTTLSLIENGKQPMREIHVLKLTNFFDVTSDYLLGYSKQGIGIYFESSQDDEDHAYISESELNHIAQEHDIQETVITDKVPFNMIIKTPCEEKIMYQGVNKIYRSVDIPKESAGINTSVREQINTELNRLDIYDLEKVLKFIREYIK